MDWYKEPDEVVRQGDIVRLSPHLKALRPPLLHLSPSTAIVKSKLMAEVLGGPTGSPVSEPFATGVKDTKLVVNSKMAFAVLLTRGCDIDHGPVRQVAVIRPLTDVQGEEAQAAIIEGKHTSLHYLPPASLNSGAIVFSDSFVDFRFLATLHRDLFDTLDRALALTQLAVSEMYFAWMRHAIGKLVPKTTDCRECGTKIEVFSEMQALVGPAKDYLPPRVLCT